MRGAAFRHLALPAIFVFCNACCLALVAAAAHVSWRLGFSVCVMYFLSLTGLGANLEKQQMLLGLRSGVWCLDCFLLGALGSWLSMLGAGWTLRPPTGRLLGVLLLGVLPQTVLGAYLLIQKQVPGAFFNVFAGIYAMVFLIWLLTPEPQSA
ncbi:unnamed protein product [Effrenium voratum]|nr:unnamed protein product [Effrenium voratum]